RRAGGGRAPDNYLGGRVRPARLRGTIQAQDRRHRRPRHPARACRRFLWRFLPPHRTAPGARPARAAPDSVGVVAGRALRAAGPRAAFGAVHPAGLEDRRLDRAAADAAVLRVEVTGDVMISRSAEYSLRAVLCVA